MAVLRGTQCPNRMAFHWFRWMPWTCEPIGAGGLAQMCPWPPQAHDFQCYGEFQGTPESVYAERKPPHPIEMCGPRGSSVQCISHAAILLLYMNNWLYIRKFDQTDQWVCGLADRQVLACGSLQQ